MDAQQPFGNEHLLPRGAREPPEHIRADTIFITSDGETAGLSPDPQTQPQRRHIECVHWPLFFEASSIPINVNKSAGSRERRWLLSAALPSRASSKACCNKAPILSTPSDSQIITGLTSEILNTINRAKKRRAEVIPAAKRCRTVSGNRPARPAYLLHARGNQDPQWRQDFDDCVRKSVFADGNPPLLPRSHHSGRSPLPALRALAWVGRRLGGLAWILDKRHRTVARENVAAAFPEKSKHDVTQLTRDHFQRLGETYCILQTGGMNAEQINNVLTFEDVSLNRFLRKIPMLESS